MGCRKGRKARCAGRVIFVGGAQLVRSSDRYIGGRLQLKWKETMRETTFEYRRE